MRKTRSSTGDEWENTQLPAPPPQQPGWTVTETILFIPFILFILSNFFFSTPNPVIRLRNRLQRTKKGGQDEEDEKDKEDVCHPVSNSGRPQRDQPARRKCAPNKACGTASLSAWPPPSFP